MNNSMSSASLWIAEGAHFARSRQVATFGTRCRGPSRLWPSLWARVPSSRTSSPCPGSWVCAGAISTLLACWCHPHPGGQPSPLGTNALSCCWCNWFHMFKTWLVRCSILNYTSNIGKFPTLRLMLIVNMHIVQLLTNQVWSNHGMKTLLLTVEFFLSWVLVSLPVWQREYRSQFLLPYLDSCKNS